jgi:deoxyribonuclease I
MLYLADRYSLTLYRSQRELLERWQRQDPPDDAERERNRRIARIQGNANPWIE